MFYKMTTILHDFTKWPKVIVHDFPLEHMELEPTFTNQGNPMSFRTRESKNHVKTDNFFFIWQDPKQLRYDRLVFRNRTPKKKRYKKQRLQYKKWTRT